MVIRGRDDVPDLVIEIIADAEVQHSHWRRGSYSPQVRFYTSTDVEELARQWQRQRGIISQYARHTNWCQNTQGPCNCGFDEMMEVIR
jgi:hypothetical protein